MSEQQLKLRGDALEWRAIEGEVVALDLRDSVYFGVNRTGALLWPELAAGAPRAALIAILAERCALPEPRAADEVDAFLSELNRLGLLEA